MKINDRREAFIEHYLQTWNSAEAARRAGYSVSNAKHLGWDLLQRPEIKQAIKDRLHDLQMQSDEVLVRLTEHARADILDLVDTNGALDIEKARAENKGRLIKKYKRTKRQVGREDDSPIIEEQIEIELHDAQAALVQLGRTMALFTDKVAGSIEVNYDDLAAELDRRIAGLAARNGTPSDSGPVQPASEG